MYLDAPLLSQFKSTAMAYPTFCTSASQAPERPTILVLTVQKKF